MSVQLGNLKFSPEMKLVIMALVDLYLPGGLQLIGLDVVGGHGKPGTHLKLEQAAYMPLVVEVIATDQIAVSHFFIQNGDLMYDPEVVFWTAPDGNWYPVQYQLDSLGIFDCHVMFGRSGQPTYVKDEKKQADLKQFCTTWARNIRAQGWLEPANVKVTR